MRLIDPDGGERSWTVSDAFDMDGGKQGPYYWSEDLERPAPGAWSISWRANGLSGAGFFEVNVGYGVCKPVVEAYE